MAAEDGVVTNRSDAEVQLPPKRLAITIAGAVSLGSYEAGVLWEVVDALAQHNANPATRDYEKIHIDVLTGASAGGMTSIILAQKLLYEGDKFVGPYDNPLYNTWVKRIDLQGLQQTEKDEPATHSLFSSNLIERISQDTLMARYKTIPPPARVHHGAVDPNQAVIRVGVALTNLNGVDYGYPVYPNLGPDDVFEYRQYSDQLTRLADFTDQTDNGDFWEPLRRAAVACGAFPIAFRPQQFDRCADKEKDDYPPDNLIRWQPDERPFTYTDGGVLQNQPIGMAKNLVDLNDCHENQDRRYYLFVSPHAKNDGPPSSFAAADGNYVRLLGRLIGTVVGQAGFRDWIRADGVNDRVRLMDQRARGLMDGLLTKVVPVGPLQDTATAILKLMVPPGVGILSPGARTSEDRADAERRIAARYEQEMFTLRSTPGIPGADIAFRDSMLAFELAAGLGARDPMQIYGITASSKELAGADLQAFLGFFDQNFRLHDYEVGRKKARDVLQKLGEEDRGDLGPIRFDPNKFPLGTIDPGLSGASLTKVPPETRERFKKALKQRVGEMVAERAKGRIVLRPVVWLVEFAAGFVLQWID